MKGAIIVLFLTIATCAIVVSPASAQDGTMMSKSEPAFIADFQGNLAFVAGQLTSLEGAVPQEKFTWRPADGVRSISEVYRHIVFGNYLMPKLMGVDPPAEANFHMDLKKWDAESTDKTEIAAAMKASFDHLRNVAGKMSAADLEKKINFFGTEMSVRSGLISALGHLHEHLGQSIAYARMNGIVPPWTAAEKEKEKEKEKESR